MIKNDNVVRCYRAIDSVTNCFISIVVKNNDFTVCAHRHGVDLIWACGDDFGYFQQWARFSIDDYQLVKEGIETFELLWQKQE